MINIFKKKDKNNNIDYKDSLSELNSVNDSKDYLSKSLLGK